MFKERRVVLGWGAAIASWVGIGQAQAAAGAVSVHDTSLRSADAEKEILHILHSLHSAFEREDLEYVSELVSKRDFLACFEIDNDGAPTFVESREHLLTFLSSMFKDYGSSVLSVKTDPRVPHAAIASENFGVTVEQCVIDTKLDTGEIESKNLRGTTAFRREADGWKIVHWHVSYA
ncbi:MAG: nuclear transport factor 2 family protein [Arenicella sp.]|nr:nuclear transport factor 2 family protein [Arenicella sp.]